MFKDIFVDLLQKTNTSAYQLSKDTGIPQSLISNYKSGKKKPSIENLSKLSAYFGVSVDYLLGNERSSLSEALDNADSFALIDESSDISSDETVFLTPEEKKIILAYRKKKNMQEAVKKLLLDDIPLVEHYAMAAYEGDTEVKNKSKKPVISP